MPRLHSKRATRGRHYKHRVIVRTQTPGMNGPTSVDVPVSARIRPLRTISTILGQPQGQAQSSQAQYEITFGTEIAIVATALIIHNDVTYKILAVRRSPDEPQSALCTVA